MSCLHLGRSADIESFVAHGGSYSVYYALAVASNEIKIDHRFDSHPTYPGSRELDVYSEGS